MWERLHNLIFKISAQSAYNCATYVNEIKENKRKRTLSKDEKFIRAQTNKMVAKINYGITYEAKRGLFKYSQPPAWFKNYVTTDPFKAQLIADRVSKVFLERGYKVEVRHSAAIAAGRGSFPPGDAWPRLIIKWEKPND